jgi:ABC-type branched-subunit amino acid transport system substrate-binding protein
VDALVREEHVIGIVGPLARAESEAAAARAEELGVPLISFSISIDPPPGARYVFRHSKSQEDEVRDLVRYAMDYLDARRFAILYPESLYGRTMMNLFWDEVQRRGGRVLAASGFSLDARGEEGNTEGLGLKRIFDNFTGVDRAVDEHDQALLETLGDHLPDPIVDFDALFIPLGADAGRYFRLVSAYPVTVDAEHVQILGTRFWNDSAVLVQTGGRLANSVFVDTYDQFGRSPLLLDFRQRHREMFGHRTGYQSPSYYTAVAYDTIHILQRLLAGRQAVSREELRRGLVNLEPSEGVTGLTSFLENGESVKESMLFKVEPRRIVRIQP